MTTIVNLITGTKVLVHQNNPSEPSPIGHSSHSPASGGNRGCYKRVEQIHPGDFLIGINNHIHQVNHCSSYLYDGPVITVRHMLSDNLDHLQPNSLILVKRRVQSMSESGGWSSIPPRSFPTGKRVPKSDDTPRMAALAISQQQETWD
jgi:hypothetical protein